MQMSTAVSNIYYSGCSETARSIEALPHDWRQSPEESVAVHRALDGAETSQLVHLYRKSKARMPLGFLRILTKARAVRIGERGKRMRAAALALDKFLHGDRLKDSEADAHSIGKLWTVVDE
jgi:hypothetical protein